MTPPSGSRLLDPQRDRDQIRAALAAGRRLVACLCAGWCSACAAWHGTFAELSREFADDCFVWIDIEDNDELVAAVEVETLPVLLVQPADGLAFVGPLEPRASVLKSMLSRNTATGTPATDPGIRAVLLS